MKLSWPIQPNDHIFVTQAFGERPSVYRQFGQKGHNGIDFRTKWPDTPNGVRYIHAAHAGTVIKKGDQRGRGYGKYIKIESSKGAQTVYAHLSKHLVKTGQRVATGEIIGLSGNTGFSSGPHLHFGYRPANPDMNNGYAGYVDPLPLLTNMSAPKRNQIPVIYIGPAGEAYLKSGNILIPFGSGSVHELTKEFSRPKVKQLTTKQFAKYTISKNTAVFKKRKRS